MPIETGDPYAFCPRSCAHDLARGVLVAVELLDHDGPHWLTLELWHESQARLVARFPMLYRRPE